MQRIALIFILFVQLGITTDGRLVHLKNVPHTSEFDSNKLWFTIQTQNFARLYNIYLDTAPIDEARQQCNNLGPKCYLTYFDDYVELRQVGVVATHIYNISEQWVNYVLNVTENIIYVGETGDEAVVPPADAFTWNGDDDLLILTWNDIDNEDGLKFENVNSSTNASYLCECEDICQPGLETCFDYEVCSITSDYFTAQCRCAVGFTGASCEVDIDDCHLDLCGDDDCIDGVASYECVSVASNETGKECFAC